VVQEKLPIKDEFRVMVVGERALAVCRRHGDQTAVAANVAQGGELTLTERPELKEPAIAAAQRNHYEICGVDLAEAEDDLYLLEANRCPVIQPVEELGVDVSGAIVDLLQERASQAMNR
jgi:glutathione synthase/RimK-type ligase-like ATP-grasp enzyme